MKKRKNRAFSTFEIIVAAAAFVFLLAVITNGMFSLSKICKLDERAVELIADAGNVVANINYLERRDNTGKIIHVDNIKRVFERIGNFTYHATFVGHNAAGQECLKIRNMIYDPRNIVHVKDDDVTNAMYLMESWPLRLRDITITIHPSFPIVRDGTNEEKRLCNVHVVAYGWGPRWDSP